jgi:hypothetical protein
MSGHPGLSVMPARGMTMRLRASGKAGYQRRGPVSR